MGTHCNGQSLRCLLYLFFLLLGLAGSFPHPAVARSSGYDIVYIWGPTLENVLDYQQKITEVLGPKVGNQLRVVGRGKEYGLIYPIDRSALSCAQLAVQQNDALRKAGLVESYVLENGEYEYLYNVSYGHGANLEALKKRYAEIYRVLGREAGKDLCIEQSGVNAYTLIYRRRGNRESSAAVARRHAILLKAKNISTTIVEENNHEIVFGESSFLYGITENSAEADADAETETKKQHSAKATEPIIISAAIARQPQDAPQRGKENPAEKDIKNGQKDKIPRPWKTGVQAQIAVHPGYQQSRQQARQTKNKNIGMLRSPNRTCERSIVELVNDLRKKGRLAKEESTGWAVYDLTRDEVVVAINADRSFQTASMVKPFVALAYFHLVQNGKLQYNGKYRSHMEAMIQRSDNASTNLFIRAIGGPARCNQILQRHYGHIFKQTRIVEYIPAGGRTYLNRASPSDYVRFLQALWKDHLPQSKEMRRVMSLPSRSRLYDGTPIPQGTLVYNKTGTTARLCGDMGILVARGKDGKRYPYALIGVIERRTSAADYGSWMASRGNVIRQVSGLVYQNMKLIHQLQ